MGQDFGDLPPLKEVYGGEIKGGPISSVVSPPKIVEPEASGEESLSVQNSNPHKWEKSGNLALISEVIADGIMSRREKKMARRGAQGALNRIEQSVPKKKERGKRLRNRLMAAGLGIPIGLVAKTIIDAAHKKKEVGVTTMLDPKPYEEQEANFNKTNFTLYSQEGMESSQLDIKGINSPDHINEAPYSLYGTPVYNLTAESGGPGWILPVAEKDGKEIIPEIMPENADFLAEQLASQLTGTSKQEILDNWVAWHKDQQAFLNFLQTHGANSTVVNFYQCSINVYNQDTDKSTWKDRLAGVQACAVKAKTELIPNEEVEQKEVARGDNFYDIANEAIIKIGGDPGEILGQVETASLMPIDIYNTTAMVGEDLAEVNNPKGLLLESNATGLVVAALFLLKIGPMLPKAILADLSNGIEGVYYWFKMGEAEKMVRDLAVLGKKLAQKTANNRDFT